MAEKLEFIREQPKDGTPTLGVVFHVVREKEIKELTGFEPIGYVIDTEEKKDG